ncbi:MAG: recombination regulator RecX [Betaproteobacteria bacterium]|nr:recombination regulator RecX [Betaproteobacteria bacterium]
MKASTQPALKGRALRLLSRREHSRIELERKLQRCKPEGQTPEDFSSVLKRALDDLQAKGLISEARVAESVVHQRASRLGQARIQHELKSKGLDDALVRQTLQDLKASEPERARGVWLKKFGTAPQTPAEHAKQTRFLASRGFSSEAIRYALSTKAPFTDPTSA